MNEVNATAADADDIEPPSGEVDNPAASTEPTDQPRRPVGRPRTPPPQVRIELVLVDGAEGRQLRQIQADAIRAVLKWFADHPAKPTPRTTWAARRSENVQRAPVRWYPDAVGRQGGPTRRYVTPTGSSSTTPAL